MGIRRIVFALGLTLVVNALGLLLLVRLHARAGERSPVDPVPEVEFVTVAIETHTLPPPARPPDPIARRSPRREGRPLPTPSLPSAIQARRLIDPELDARHIIQPLFDLDPEDYLDFSRLVMTAETVDEPPRVVHRVHPEYPMVAENMRLSGEVVIKMLVDRQGKVVDATVEAADPPDIFDEQSLRAVRQWQFDPAVYKGHRVASWCRTRLIFNLEDR